MKYVLKVTQAEVSQVQANSFGTCMYNTSSVLRFLCQVCKSLDGIVEESPKKTLSVVLVQLWNLKLMVMSQNMGH